MEDHARGSTAVPSLRRRRRLEGKGLEGRRLKGRRLGGRRLGGRRFGGRSLDGRSLDGRMLSGRSLGGRSLSRRRGLLSSFNQLSETSLKRGLYPSNEFLLFAILGCKGEHFEGTDKFRD